MPEVNTLQTTYLPRIKEDIPTLEVGDMSGPYGAVYIKRVK
jgi:hypothetical protein